MSAAETIKNLGDYINGEFQQPEGEDGHWVIKSPANLRDIVYEGVFYYDNIDKACLAAKAAFHPWAKLGLEKRIEYMNRLKEVYQTNTDKLATTISRETGKPFWEAKTEVVAMIGKISITIDHSLKLVADEKIENIQAHTDGWIRFKPRGVMAVLGPFNFPGHLP
ncbi:MAG: aldehyde dehydrogenase family protein, partial [Bdellovibrionales bacterium]|nr:aldehyde dehydrogenase family protein [Bdellovibrionales bacterium]